MKHQDLRIGFIGTGNMSIAHAKRLVRHGARISALCDPSPESIARFQERARECLPAKVNVYSDYRELLDRESLDGVLIASPHTLHCQQILDSLDRGFHVLAEKPLACSTEETQAIIRKSQETKREVVVSYQRRFMPMFRYVRRFVHSPSFGNVYLVQAFQSQAWMYGTKGTWRQNPQLSGGGQIHDSGSHLVDILFWLLPTSVTAVSAWIENHGCPVDIDSTIQFRLKSGGLGTIAILGSAQHRDMWEDITLSGDHGQSVFIRNGKVWANHTFGSPLEEVTNFEYNGETDPDVHFVKVIRGESVNESPPTDYLRVIRFTEACWESGAKGGVPVALEISE